MFSRKAPALAVLAAMALSSTAGARERSYMVVANGRGTLSADGARAEVTKVVYTVYPNGRVNFAALGEGGAMGFSGSADRHPDLRHYYLELDSVLPTQGGKAVREAATGECAATFSGADGKTFETVACRAETAKGRLELTFHGDGRPSEGQPLD
jgi:hypothetical protein